MTTGVANAQTFGAVGDGSHDDTVALQAALDYCFGSAASPHGLSYYQNKVLYIPPGHYKTTAPLLITKLVGGAIWGAGRFSTTIENVTGGLGTGDVFRSNGMSFSHMADMQLSCHANGICIDLDWDGTLGGIALQANSFDNLMCFGNYESGTYGVRIGHGGLMGSECIFKMLHNQGCMVAGVSIDNFNAVQHQFYGGQDQACGIGIWSTVGSAQSINGRGFQAQVDCDIKISGAYYNACSIAGCRTESANFIINEGGQSLDISACVQSTPSTPGYFIKSNGGYINIRSCLTNAQIFPNASVNMTIEGSEFASFHFDMANLWWVPNNVIAANVLIRNSAITDVSIAPIINQRRYTTDGIAITTKDVVYA